MAATLWLWIWAQLTTRSLSWQVYSFLGLTPLTKHTPYIHLWNFFRAGKTSYFSLLYSGPNIQRAIQSEISSYVLNKSEIIVWPQSIWFHFRYFPPNPPQTQRRKRSCLGMGWFFPGLANLMISSTQRRQILLLLPQLGAFMRPCKY